MMCRHVLEPQSNLLPLVKLVKPVLCGLTPSIIQDKGVYVKAKVVT